MLPQSCYKRACWYYRAASHRRYNYLFLRGEAPGVSVEGVTLIKCLTEQQIQAAIAPHPDYASASMVEWPPQRQGVRFRQNRWVNE